MSEDRRYFEEELNYLVEAGQEYARLHPERARYLNFSDSRSRDPHVQRLIEAFAFLTGNVRRRIDDDFPEITHALLDLVWPHYMRPIPPIALLKFTPIPGMVREPQVVPRGFLVDSKLTSEEVVCRFSTAFPVEIVPLRIEEVAPVTDDAGRQILRFRFAFEEGAEPKDFDFDRLRIFISGEPTVAFGIYHVLRTMVQKITLRFSRERKRVLANSRVEPVGFGKDEEVLPYPAVSFPGYRLLSEYFAFREKFRFVDFRGLGTMELEKGESEFEMDLEFDSRPPDSFRPSTDNFHLFVTPIVNLFPRNGEPIQVDQLKTKYRVIGDYTHADAFDVISVDKVEGIRKSDGERRRHFSFYSFQHDPSDDGTAEDECVSYLVSHNINASGKWATHLSLVSNTRNALPSAETLSLDLTCSNGALCREVGIEEIRVGAADRLDFVTFRNITRPTSPVYPRIGGGAEWRFISHMALTFLSVSEPGALKTILSLYDIGDSPANQRRIESIQAISTRPRDLLILGAPVRGTEVRITVDERHFDDLGDLLLFGEILNEFLALHTTINSFAELVVHRIPSEKEYRCPPAHGKKQLV